MTQQEGEPLKESTELCEKTGQFSLSRAPVDLIQGQDHLDLHQNVRFNSIYHHTRFEGNRLVDVPVHVSVKFVRLFVLT